MELDTIAIGGALGAEIRGLDPRSFDDEQAAALRRAILEHEVVFLRGVDFDEDEQLRFASRFGSPSVFPLGRLMGASGPTLQVIADGPGNPSRADDWHTDVTWVAEPPAMAFLQSLVAPERGGDTLWASMTAAFDALSPTMQRMVSGLTVRHDNESFIRGLVDKAPEMAREHDLPARLRNTFPPVEHPLVRTHPETGRQALFLGGRFMRHIVGMEPAESDMLLGFLEAHVNDARFHVRWRWTPGDLAIWDERSTNHRAAGDSGEQERVIRRIEIDGTRPFHEPAR